MITGSIASSLQGEPRATHDIDLIVRMGPKEVESLLNAFPSPDYYAEESAVRDAVSSGGMFNIVEAAEGDKIDFWLLTETPFDRSRFSRKHSEEVFGITIQVSSPEDTILAKLHWSKLSEGSEKHFQDALRVFEVQSELLDLGYLQDWAERLSVTDLFERVRREAERL